eukprot:TRINITY_DN3137_c0_g1_i2.p1 TRINITY_DN3137_c0_g1~~TRINITY_DN3137_c0_g1_i2.p1  ORF type:complete len:273 (-),score=41.16 TRINITY_DN3137_c0_g1_i2:31-849(-)
MIEGDPAAVQETHRAIEALLGFPVGCEPLVVVILDIPREKYGAVIGQRGATIRQIERRFGVGLSLPQSPEEGLPQMEGTVAGTHAAVAHIETLVGLPIASKTRFAGPTKAKLDLVTRPIMTSLFFPEKIPGSTANLDRMLEFIQSATKSLDICVFTISNDKLSTAIVLAHQQKIAVRVITDNDTSTGLGSDISRLRQAGISVRTDSTPAHMHHKFCIVDGVLLINGSFNWSRQAAVANHENVVVTNARPLVEQFSSEFDYLWRQFAASQPAR